MRFEGSILEASAVINPSKNDAEIQDRFLMRFLPTLVRFWCHFGRQKTTQSAPKSKKIGDFGKTFLDALKKPPKRQMRCTILEGLAECSWPWGDLGGGKNSQELARTGENLTTEKS